MLDPAHFVGGGPRAQHLQISIDLRAIGVDDHAVRALGEGNPKRRLAARGRPCDDAQRRNGLDHCDADSSRTARRQRPCQGHRDRRWRGSPLDRRGRCRRPAAWPGRGLARPAGRVGSALPGIDIIVQPVEGREKRLLVADMDSTMIGQECIDELADFAGKKAEIAAVTERAMQGEMDFEEALHARVAAAQRPRRRLPRTLPDRTRRPITPGARTLVQTMRRRRGDPARDRGLPRFRRSVGCRARLRGGAGQSPREHVRPSDREGHRRDRRCGGKARALIERRDQLGLGKYRRAGGRRSRQ